MNNTTAGPHLITMKTFDHDVIKCTFFLGTLYFFMREKKGKLVRFNSHSVGTYTNMHGSSRIIVEESAVGVMLDYSPENLCEVLLGGDIIFNIDPDNLDDVTDSIRTCV